MESEPQMKRGENYKGKGFLEIKPEDVTSHFRERPSVCPRGSQLLAKGSGGA